MTTSTFLTIGDLCERWKLSQPTIRRMVRDGRLRATQIGRSVRFDLQDVERMETAGKQRQVKRVATHDSEAGEPS